ncbi:recombinase family protein [Jiangella alkaliphila]|uniref:recombinase family protein n=1 Tax=Jiangella alkaliphila TaxID=419479 RepID=UPI0018D4697F|nr:recombinase family protein [Jiangella alkaliphila]
MEGTEPIYLYLRLSRYHRDGADAIERHRVDLLRKLAAEGRWTVMGEYIDNDSASKSAVRSRKGWRRLNDDIRAGVVRAVAFWKLDRTSRIATKCLEWIGECQSRGVYLISHQDSADELNSASAGAKLVTGVKALLAEVETDTMSERQLAAKQHLAEAGFFHGGTVPLGWMRGPRVTDRFGRTGVRLVPHPVEFPALKDATSMVLAGKSIDQVARHWRDHYGITTSSGALLYEPTIYRALISPRMVGYRMRKVPEHRRGVKLELLDYVVRDRHGNPIIAHEPVCDLATWFKVRQALNRAKTSGTRRPWGSHPWLLTGLCFCLCGGRLYCHHKTHINAAGDKRRDYTYWCLANRRMGPGTCPTGCSIGAAKAEAYVLGWFFAQLTDPALGRAVARRRAADGNREIEAVLARLDEAKTERSMLIGKQGTPTYRGSMVTVLLGLVKDVQRRIDELQQRLDALTTAEPPINDGARVIAAWPSLEISEKRNYLRRVIDRIEVRSGRDSVEDRMLILPAQ